MSIAEAKSKCAAKLQDDLNDQGLVTQLVLFLNEALPLKADSISVDLKSYALLLCGALCNHRPHARELFGSSGVNMLVLHLQRASEYLKFGWNSLVTALVDCIWSCIVGTDLTELQFLQQEGIFLLLDLLETCPLHMRNQIVGCTLDLCSNDKALHHATKWTGGGNDRTNFITLVCKIWNETCQRLACPLLGQNSIVIVDNPERFDLHPLKGTSQVVLMSFDAVMCVRLSLNNTRRLQAQYYKMFC